MSIASVRTQIQTSISKKGYLLADTTMKAKGVGETPGVQAWLQSEAHIMFLGLCASSFPTPSRYQLKETLAS